MFTNRVLFVIGILSLLLVGMVVSLPLDKGPSAEELRWPARPIIAPVSDLAEAQPDSLDSATRSYIAQGKALQAAAEQAACSSMAQEKIWEKISSDLDSATRSYIAQGLALQAKNDIRACH